MLRGYVLVERTVKRWVSGVVFAVLDAASVYLTMSKGFTMPSGFRLLAIFCAVLGVGVWGYDL